MCNMALFVVWCVFKLLVKPTFNVPFLPSILGLVLVSWLDLKFRLIRCDSAILVAVAQSLFCARSQLCNGGRLARVMHCLTNCAPFKPIFHGFVRPEMNCTKFVQVLHVWHGSFQASFISQSKTFTTNFDSLIEKKILPPYLPIKRWIHIFA